MSARVEPLYPDGAGTPRELHALAVAEAEDWSLAMSASGQIGFPWQHVHAIVGTLAPGWLVLVGGRAKGGKTTFLREVFNSWVSEFQKRVLYVGTEQGAGLLRLLWAALRCHAPIEAVIDPTHPRHIELLYDVSQAQGRLADQALVVAEPDLSLAKFVQWARYAYSHGFQVLMLDHFHRIEVGSSDGWRDRGSAVRAIKNVATRSGMLVVAAAQMKNGEGGALGEYEVPGSNSWAETASLRREADVAIQVWRPFRPRVTREQKQAARDDMTKLPDVVDAGVMAVRCDAHRYLDAAPYKAARLYVHEGQVTSWPGGIPPRYPED